MWTVVGMLALLLSVASFVGLFIKRYRGKSKWLLPISFVVALVAIGNDTNQEARESGFANSTDMRRAGEAGFTDPEAWRAHRAEAEREEAARAAEERAVTEARQAEEAQRRAANDALRTPPPEQQALIDAVAKSRTAYRSAANDMAKGATRPQRASAVCSAIQSPRVSNWVGQVTNLSSNNEGKGVLTVQVGDNVAIGTWNNSLSDFSANSLIDPGSSVFQAAMNMSKGTWVMFSGSFISDEVDCFKEMSITLNGSMTDPEFVFRFSEIKSLQ